MRILCIGAVVLGAVACTSPETETAGVAASTVISEVSVEEPAQEAEEKSEQAAASTSSTPVADTSTSTSSQTTTTMLSSTTTSTIEVSSSSAWIPTCEVFFHQSDMQYMDWMDEAMFSIAWVDDEFGNRAMSSSEVMDEFGDVSGTSFNVVVEFSSRGEFEGVSTYDNFVDEISFDVEVGESFDEVFFYYLDGDPDFLAGEVRTHEATAKLSPGGSCAGSLETRAWNDEVVLREEFGWPEQPVGWNRW